MYNNTNTAIGKGDKGKVVEIEQKMDLVKIDNIVSLFVKPDQIDAICIDHLDSLIAVGVLVDSPGPDTEEHVP